MGLCHHARCLGHEASLICVQGRWTVEMRTGRFGLGWQRTPQRGAQPRQIGILKHDGGVLPAEFQTQLFELGATWEAIRVVACHREDTAAMSGWVTMASPTSGPRPCSTLNTPSGNPDSLIHVLRR